MTSNHVWLNLLNLGSWSKTPKTIARVEVTISNVKLGGMLGSPIPVDMLPPTTRTRPETIRIADLREFSLCKADQI